MTASSGVVLANLAYLIGAVVLAVIGGLAFWLRNRKPTSVDANMASFNRGLRALAPERGGTVTASPIVARRHDDVPEGTDAAAEAAPEQGAAGGDDTVDVTSGDGPSGDGPSGDERSGHGPLGDDPLRGDTVGNDAAGERAGADTG